MAGVECSAVQSHGVDGTHDVAIVAIDRIVAGVARCECANFLSLIRQVSVGGSFQFLLIWSTVILVAFTVLFWFF